MKVATPIKMVESSSGLLLLVRSIRKREEVEAEGRQYEWGINKYTFSHYPNHVKERLALTETEYKSWLSKF